MRKEIKYFHKKFPLIQLIQFNPPVSMNNREFVNKHIHISPMLQLALCCSVDRMARLLSLCEDMRLRREVFRIGNL